MTFDISVIMDNLPLLGHGLALTLLIVAASFLCGCIIAMGIVAASRSDRRSFRLAASGYINIFRNMPELVLIFWLYYCLPQIVDLRVSPFTTGVMALSLSAGAYLAEIFRSGIQALNAGQWEAARSLGLHRLLVWRLVIGPQVFRVVRPLLVNYMTELLKFSTLVSAIGVSEIVHTAMQLGGQTFRYLELFTAVGVVFFLIIFPLSLMARAAGAQRASR